VSEVLKNNKMTSIKPPKTFEIEENSGNNWELWKQSFKFYAKATGLEKQEDEVQVATFMSIIGYAAIPILNSFKLSSGT